MVVSGSASDSHSDSRRLQQVPSSMRASALTSHPAARSNHPQSDPDADDAAGIESLSVTPHSPSSAQRERMSQIDAVIDDPVLSLSCSSSASAPAAFNSGLGSVSSSGWTIICLFSRVAGSALQPRSQDLNHHREVSRELCFADELLQESQSTGTRSTQAVHETRSAVVAPAPA